MIDTLNDLLARFNEYLMEIAAGVLILGILGGTGYFTFTTILPAWNERVQLVSDLAIAEETVLVVEQSRQRREVSLRADVETGPERIRDSASFLLPPGQADVTINNLYRHADENAVSIVEVQSIPTPSLGFEEFLNIKTYQLLARGSFSQLVRFLSNIEATNLSGYIMRGVKIEPLGEEEHVLALTLLLYTSEMREDDVLMDAEQAATEQLSEILPTPEPPAATPTPAATAEPESTAMLEAAATPASTQVYLVKRGDTLFLISQEFGTTVEALKQANGLTSDRIDAGQELIIPSP